MTEISENNWFWFPDFEVDPSELTNSCLDIIKLRLNDLTANFYDF